MNRRTLEKTLTLVGLTVIMASCAKPADSQLTTLEFIATYGDQEVSCEQPLDERTALTDLRFMVSDVELGSTAGEWQAATTQRVELLDFENGAGPCLNGTVEKLSQLAVRQQADARGLRFTLGVPFDLNHQDPLKATAPLDQPVMHWHWQSGYKFIRAGIVRDGVRWHIHLGSTGCQGPMTAVTHCDQPNRAFVELPLWQPGDQVVMKLDALLHGVLVRGPGAHCLASAADENCRRVSRNLGLDPQTGSPSGDQRVFAVRASDN